MPKLTPTFNDEKKIVSLPPRPPVESDLGNGSDDKSAIELAPKAVEKPKEAEYLKVALIGTAPSSRLLAPYSDPTWQIWACSPGNMNQIPRFDVWFEIHSTLHYPENKHYGDPYLAWLRTINKPLYMQAEYIQAMNMGPHAIALPKDELVKEFGKYFFTSSFAWMMALAMKKGAKEILLFGIDMASRDEYILQRPGAYFFFQEANRRGVKIGAPMESDILQPPPLYGFCDSTSFGRKLVAREQELKERVGDMRRQRDGLVANITYLEGALEDLDYIKNIWGGAQE